MNGVSTSGPEGAARRSGPCSGPTPPANTPAEVIYRSSKAVGYIRAASDGFSLGGAVGRAMIEAGEFIIKAFIHDGEREVDIGGTRYPADVSLWPMYYPKMERIKA